MEGRKQRPRIGGRRGSRSGRRGGGREEPRGRRGEESSRRAGRGRPSLVEVLGEAKAVIDYEDDGSGSCSDSSGARDERAHQPYGGAGGGARAEVWMPSTTTVRPAEVWSPTSQAGARRESAWMEEDRAVARRLEHLDKVAARLEEAGAEIEANIELLGVEHGRPRSAVHDHTGGNSLQQYYRQGWARTDETLGREGGGSRLDVADGGGGAGGGRVRQRRSNEGGTPAAQRSLGTARGRLKARGGVVSRRLVAPTVSSNNKAKSSSGGGSGGAMSRDRGTTMSKSPTRHRTQKKLSRSRGRTKEASRNDDFSDYGSDREGRVVAGGVHRGGQVLSRSGRTTVFKDQPTRVRQGGRRSGRQHGGDTWTADEESPERRSARGEESGRLRSSRDGDINDDIGGRDGDGEREHETASYLRERQETEGQEEDMRSRYPCMFVSLGCSLSGSRHCCGDCAINARRFVHCVYT